MTREDYEEIFRSTRLKLREAGLGLVDERIMSDLSGSVAQSGGFRDLITYLKKFTEEVELGSEAQVANILRRANRHVKTRDGGPIQGVRVHVAEEDIPRFGTEVVDLSPNAEFGEIAQDLRGLIDELVEDHGSNSNTQ